MPHQINSVHSPPVNVVAGMAPETTSGMAQERDAGQAQPSSDCGGADKPGSSAGSGAGDGAAAEQEAPPAAAQDPPAAEDSSGAAQRDAASASGSEAEDVSQAAALVLPENLGATIQQWIGRLKASGRRKADLLDLLPQLSGAALAAALAAAAAAPAGGAAPPAGGAGGVGADPPVDDSAGDDAQSQAQMWLGLLRRLATMGAKDVSTSAPALPAARRPASSRFLLAYKCIAQV